MKVLGKLLNNMKVLVTIAKVQLKVRKKSCKNSIKTNGKKRKEVIWVRKS